MAFTGACSRHVLAFGFNSLQSATKHRQQRPLSVLLQTNSVPRYSNTPSLLQRQQQRSRFRWTQDLVSLSAHQDDFEASENQKRVIQSNNGTMTTATAVDTNAEHVNNVNNVPSKGYNSTDDIVELSESTDSSGTDQPKQDTSFLAIDPEDVHVTVVQGEQSLPQTDIQFAADTEPTFVNMFRGSANYIANHRGTLAVYHIPGDLMDMDDASFLRDLMNDIALSWLLGMKIVIVVGCRYQIDRRLPGREKHHGVTVTDQDTLRIVKEEAGYVRFEIERQLARSLRMQGVDNFISGRSKNSYNGNSNNGNNDDHHYDGNVVSGNFYTAQPFGILDGVDYKYTGFVRRVEAGKIRQVHQSRDIVLLTTLGVSPSGEAFNVNSESLAATVAGALEASKIVYFTESEVELQHKSHGHKIPHLRVKDAHNLLQYNGVNVHKRGFVNVGDSCPKGRSEKNMLIKIGWGMHALEQGVKRAHIISPKHGALLQELYTRDGSGTMLSRDLYDGIRQGKVEDVSAIHELITPLILMGTLVDRPKAVLEKTIDTYHVYTRDDLVVACGQLKLFENDFAEIGCLVVDSKYRARGRGDAMLGYLERLCVQKGASYVFVLSTQTMEWFIERGFEEVGVNMLPPSRQATYNVKRNSKIYMKKINSLRDLDASELWWNR